MKKLLYIFGGLIALVLVAIVTIPLFYDVNTRVRPKIVEAIESNMNAKTEIGKLGLSLWGGIYITIDSFRLLDLSGEPVFEMKDAKLAIPFSTILGGSLNVSLIVDKPVLHVVKSKQGVLNVSNLMKPKAKTDSGDTEKSEGGSSSGGGAKNAERVSFSTEIHNALINYRDLATGQKATVDNLTLITKNVTVNKPFSLLLVAGLDYSKPPEISVKGDLKVEGDIEAKISDAGFDSVSLKSKIILDGLAVKYGALFNKDAGVPFGFSTDLLASASSLDMKSVEAVLNDFKVAVSGKVENFSAPVLDIKIASNKLDLEAWRPVLAAAKEYEMDGNIGFDMNLKGALDQLMYSGSLSMKGLGMKVPGVVPRATDLSGEVRIENNLVRLEKTSIKFGASDMSFAGTVQDFAAPNIQVQVNSKLLDLDQMMPAKPKAEKEKEAQPTVAVSEKEQDAKMEAMAKGPIDSIKKNPVMRKMVFKSTTKISKLVVSKAELTDFSAQVDFDNLVLSLANASMKAFKGAIQSKMSVDFKGVEPAYAVSGNVKDLEIDEAVVSQMPDMKDFISGRTFANISITGAGVAPSRVKANLKGSGNFEIKNGKWSGFSPLKVIGEKLSSIPGAKDKLGGVNVGNKFRQLKSQFDIRDSKMILKDTIAELEEARTTITAEGYIGFDKTMKVNGMILAPVSNPPPKINNGDGRAKIPYEVSGSVSSPATNWGATLGPVGQAYLEEEGKKVLKKGLEKVQESLQDGKIKDLLKGINF